MVSIIILSFNTKDLLKECLFAIQETISDTTHEVIVIDNASKDESVAMVRKAFPKVIVIQNTENAGFAKGINIGARKASGEYLLFLNSDAKLQGKLEKMVSFMKSHEDCGILGGLLKNIDGTEQRSYGSFYTIQNTLQMLIGGEKLELAKQNIQDTKQVDWVSGGFMLVRKTVFEKLGGFDEAFFMYLEDMELCYRAKKAGYHTYFLPEVSAVHVGQGSSNRTFAIVHIYKGLLYFYHKHKPAWQYQFIKFVLIWKAWVAIAIGTLTHNGQLTQTYRKAIQW